MIPLLSWRKLCRSSEATLVAFVVLWCCLIPFAVPYEEQFVELGMIRAPLFCVCFVAVSYWTLTFCCGSSFVHTTHLLPGSWIWIITYSRHSIILVGRRASLVFKKNRYYSELTSLVTARFHTVGITRTRWRDVTDFTLLASRWLHTVGITLLLLVWFRVLYYYINRHTEFKSVCRKWSVFFTHSMSFTTLLAWCDVIVTNEYYFSSSAS